VNEGMSVSESTGRSVQMKICMDGI